MELHEALAKAQELEQLYAKLRDLQPYDDSKWVGLGLMTPPEYEDYKQAEDIKRKATVAGEKTKETLPRFNKEDNLPEDFVALTKQREVLKEELGPYKEALNFLSSILYARRDNSFFYLPTEQKEKIEAIHTVLEEQAGVLSSQLYQIEAEIKPRERLNSRVVRIRGENWKRYEAGRQAANLKARREYLAPYTKAIRKGKVAEEAMAERVGMLRQDILKQIDSLFSSMTGRQEEAAGIEPRA